MNRGKISLDLWIAAHIFRQMLSRVKKTISRKGLLANGDRVLVALSGGPDSVALLHLLAALRREFDLTLGAVYVNHGIRPTAARREERFCAALCAQLGVELEVVRANIPRTAKESGQGIEEAAREFRYALFERLAKEKGYDRIAVGHQADDQAETVLFRVLRGTGRRGLSGIPFRRGRIVRPLLEVTRAEVLEYLRELGAEYCEDRTNRRMDYRRNYLRHRLLPLLEKEVNPGVRRALVALGETSADEEEYLDAVTAEALRLVLSRTAGEKFALDLRRLKRYDRWIRRRLLRYCLSESSADGMPPNRDVIERLEEMLSGGTVSVSLPGKLLAVTTGKELVICRAIRAGFSLELPLEGVADLDWPRLCFRTHVSRGRPRSIPKRRQARRARMDLDRVRPPLVVRNIRPGDRFRPLGLGGTKKVGDYLTDRRVSRVYRDEIPVVCDRDGIVWLVGWELSDRVKIDAATRKVITVECSERLPDQAETV